MKVISLLGFSLLIFLFGLAVRAEALLYFENQFIFGYSSTVGRPIFFSSSQQEVMQKPSIGFDYLQKFSSDYRDMAVLALQGRLAWNESAEPKIEPQLYNAYLKFKDSPADFWLGHNRPAFGLASYFDSHAQLLSTLGMTVLGFDRDWGAGVSYDFEWGDWSFSATNGSGMSFYWNDNYLLASRISRGILAQDNYNFGISLAYGRVPDSMGIHLMDKNTHDIRLAGLDMTYMLDNIELRAEVIGGTKNHQNISSYFFRQGLNLWEENRLKLEAQEIIIGSDSYQLGAGVTYIINPDLTVRALLEKDWPGGYKITGQIYSYSFLIK